MSNKTRVIGGIGASGRLPRRTLLAAPFVAGIGAVVALPVAAARAGDQAVQAALPRAMREAVAEARLARFPFGAMLAGVAYGTSIETLIRYGWEQIAIPQREVVARADFNRMPIVGPVFTEETDPLYAAGQPR